MNRASDLVASDPNTGIVTTPLRSLTGREPISIDLNASIREAASLMREQRISSVLLTEDGRLRAILTDRDLRDRVVAEGRNVDTPALNIATESPLTIDIQKTAFDALLLMARHGIHHLPVMENKRVVGMLSSNDLTGRHSSSAVFLAAQINDQTSREGLAIVSARIRELQGSLAAAGASAHATGQVITALTDVLTRKLLSLAHLKLGPAPIPYAWVAAGSQARMEQTAKSDQDNCMILDDAYDPARHEAYFRQLARFVCAGLDACGYVYCPGEMMAQTDTWRQPLAIWKQSLRNWIEEPEPMALMLTCVFFDLRFVDGEASLVDALRADFLPRAGKNRFFLAHLVGNALKHRPALNLFGHLAPARSGQTKGKIDLKHQGTVPIIDLARIYALSAGLEAVNTWDRLDSAAASAEVSEQGARDLRDALEFLATLRIRHQVKMVEAGLPADNLLALREISNFERTQLRNAFAVVQTLQNVLKQRY
jgi:CBS domain-containing protein